MHLLGGFIFTKEGGCYEEKCILIKRISSVKVGKGLPF